MIFYFELFCIIRYFSLPYDERFYHIFRRFKNVFNVYNNFIFLRRFFASTVESVASSHRAGFKGSPGPAASKGAGT